MPPKLVLIGMKFGRLLVIAEVERERSGQAFWKCRCDCGHLRTVRSQDLRNGHTLSCGCHRRERSAATCHVHGFSKTPTYRSWAALMDRCTNPNDSGWPDYGGRGIKVCERWRSVANFIEDMGERPGGKTLDRIDPNGDYEPANCRWATPKEQAKNKRLSRERIEAILTRMMMRASASSDRALLDRISREIFGAGGFTYRWIGPDPLMPEVSRP